MKRILACLATLALTLSVSGAQAEPLDSLSDPVGDLIAQVLQKAGVRDRLLRRSQPAPDPARSRCLHLHQPPERQSGRRGRHGD